MRWGTTHHHHAITEVGEAVVWDVEAVGAAQYWCQ